MTKAIGWLVVPILIFLLLSWAYFPESIDDAYITLRYAKNLMHGYGPVFNVGEHVEGYSNPVWMFFLAATGWLGFSMPMAMKVLGITSGVGTIYLSEKLARKWSGSAVIGIGAAFFVSASSFMALWAADGLETSFYCFLVTLLMWLVCSETERGWQIGVVAALVALTRPEGSMFAILIVFYQIFCRQYIGAARCVTVWFIAFLGYEIFRVSYFGEWVPNTALVKVHASKESIGAAINYVKSFNRDSGYFLLPLAFGGAILNLNSRNFLLATSFILAQMFFLAVCGGDFMFGYRFLMPIFPAIVLLVCGMNKLMPERIIISGAALILLGACLGLSQFSSRPPMHFGLDNITYRASEHFKIAEYLNERTVATDTVLLSEAGIIPFGIEARVDDYLGLVSPYWMVHARDGTFSANNLLAHKPKYIVLSFVENADGSTSPRLFQDAKIFNATEFAEHYISARRFEINKNASLLNYIYYFYSPPAKLIYFEVYQRSS